MQLRLTAFQNQIQVVGYGCGAAGPGVSAPELTGEQVLNSRAAGQGTSNYVVFDDRMIDIIKKYGIAGLIAAGAYHHQEQQ